MQEMLIFVKAELNSLLIIMKRYITSLFLLFTLSFVSAQVPTYVASAFKQSHPTAPAKWKRSGKTTYQAMFKENGNTVIETYHSTGKLLGRKSQLGITELPIVFDQKLSATFNNNFRIDKAYKMEKGNSAYFLLYLTTEKTKEKLKMSPSASIIAQQSKVLPAGSGLQPKLIASNINNQKSSSNEPLYRGENVPDQKESYPKPTVEVKISQKELDNFEDTFEDDIETELELDQLFLDDDGLDDYDDFDDNFEIDLDDDDDDEDLYEDDFNFDDDVDE